jgi:hypothetical protein
MENELSQAVIAAANKEYKSFEKVAAAATEEKMKAHLTGFMSYLEKNTFKTKD